MSGIRALHRHVLRVSLLLGLCLAAKTAGAQCAPPYLVEWPAAAPVWTMCWLPPDQSSGPDGSGLELRYVRYRGKLMFWRIDVPVLNVLYDPGSGWCGPTYRDWLNELQAFDANNVISPGYAEPTQPPTTVWITPDPMAAASPASPSRNWPIAWC